MGFSIRACVSMCVRVRKFVQGIFGLSADVQYAFVLACEASASAHCRYYVYCFFGCCSRRHDVAVDAPWRSEVVDMHLRVVSLCCGSQPKHAAHTAHIVRAHTQTSTNMMQRHSQ